MTDEDAVGRESTASFRHSTDTIISSVCAPFQQRGGFEQEACAFMHRIGEANEGVPVLRIAARESTATAHACPQD